MWVFEFAEAVSNLGHISSDHELVNKYHCVGSVDGWSYVTSAPLLETLDNLLWLGGSSHCKGASDSCWINCFVEVADPDFIPFMQFAAVVRGRYRRFRLIGRASGACRLWGETRFLRTPWVCIYGRIKEIIDGPAGRGSKDYI